MNLTTGENGIGRDNSKLMNKIINEDCLIAMDYIEDKSIDMILADVPYG